MLVLHTVSFYLHIMFGSAALLLFWVPVFSRKGGLDHKRFGRYYAFTMKMVAASGALMALLVIGFPYVIKQEILQNSANPEYTVEIIRAFWGLLLYLALLTYTSVKQGLKVLTLDNDTAPLRQWQHIAFPLLLTLGAPIMIALGVHYQQPLQIIFGCLGGTVGFKSVRFCLAQQHSRSARIMEHLSAISGSGIGAYTAFFAFGGRTLIGDIGHWQIAFWVLPGVIGSILISRACRPYQAAPKPLPIGKKQNSSEVFKGGL